LSSLGKKILGSSAIVSKSGEFSSVDMGSFVRRLLLFDNYVLVSHRLQEFRFLADHLGVEQTSELLDSGLITIRNECLQLADCSNLVHFGLKRLPPLQFRLDWIDFHDRRTTTSQHLECLRELPNVSIKRSSQFRRLIAGKISPLPAVIKSDAGEDFFSEIQKTNYMRKAVVLAAKGLSTILPEDFTFRLHRNDDILELDTDLVGKFGFDTPKVHMIFQRALIGLGSLSQQLSEMNHFEALSGYRENESPLFTNRLRFAALALHLTSEELEQDFQSVLSISQIPEYDLSEPLKVDRLLKLRETDELSAFRNWLQNGGAKSEAEIREMIGGLRNTLSLAFNSGAVKILRFLTTNLSGAIPTHGAVIGPAVSLIDSTLSELLSKPHVTAFIDDLYPSLFERG
jgi:hypothetical protein